MVWYGIALKGRVGRGVVTVRMSRSCCMTRVYRVVVILRVSCHTVRYAYIGEVVIGRCDEAGR